MRRYAEHLRKRPQKVKWAKPGGAGRAVEIERLVRVLIEPQRNFDGAPAVPRMQARRSAPAASDRVDTAGDEQPSGLFEADVASPLGCRLRKLSGNHQLGQRRHAANLPYLAAAADPFDHRWCKIERQALIAPGVMIVGASVLRARPPHEDRSCDELERLVMPPIAEAAPAHVRDRGALVLLGERRVRGARAAAIVEDRKCFGSR